MLIALPLAIFTVAALAWRHASGPAGGSTRTVLLIAGLALGVRFLAALVVTLIAHQSHWTDVWLSDEASFFLATESLLPNPFDRALPQGLEHLSGDGYLGVTTALAVAGGVADAHAFRVVNAAFGACVVVLTTLVSRELFGARAALVAGLGAALWPDLVLWSATFLRDTLGSLAVVAVWWALVTAPRQRRVLHACVLVLVLIVLATLREYVAVTVAIGLLAWFGYPFVRRQQPGTIVAVAAAGVAVIIVAGVFQARRLDEAEHALFYRQTVTRMEALGRLYRDPPPPDQPIQLPFRPGQAIAVPDPNTGWLLTGLVIDSAEPGFVSVSLTDGTDRRVAISDVELLQDARIPPLQVFSFALPSLGSVFVGLPGTSEAPNVRWILAALLWDALLALAVLGLVRTRQPARDWLFPMCVVLGTVLALSAIPGSPGNAERHRANQTLPLLLVLASGVFASRRTGSTTVPGRAAISATSMPTRATTAVASSSRSER